MKQVVGESGTVINCGFSVNFESDLNKARNNRINPMNHNSG